MNRFLSLEDEVGLQISLGVNPAKMTQSHESVKKADALSLESLIALKINRQALVKLEAMGSFIKKQNPSDIGRCGVLFANVALEELCESVNLDLQNLVIDQAVYSQNPEEAVANGLATIQTSKKELLNRIHTSLTELLSNLSHKRETLNGQIGLLWRTVGDLEKMVEQGGCADESVLKAWQGFEKLCYFSTSRAAGAGFMNNVVSDVSHFLTEHSHLYKRLIKKEIDWIADHKKSTVMIDQYVFNPVEYVCNGQQEYGLNASEAEPLIHYRGRVYRGTELPGGRAFWSYTTQGTVFGLDGIEAMGAAKSHLGEFRSQDKQRFLEAMNGPVFTENNENKERVAEELSVVPRLDLENCKARLSEIKRGLKNLEHWSDIAYVKLWKDAYFEQEVMGELLKTEANTVLERGLTAMANGIMAQLVQASNDVGEYAVDVFTQLLTYVQLSLKTTTGEDHA